MAAPELRVSVNDTPTKGSQTYAIIVCMFASLGGFFFGYDQGVTSGVLIMDSFLEDYCISWHNFTYEDCTRSSWKMDEFHSLVQHGLQPWLSGWCPDWRLRR
ncbi:hypothetical protein PC115_g7334 [Phytophthora cactorum]|uniref:Major facilitator superfamily (MFS) profile domain-containing protein n=1 Tax=Phytophthora cactorum TaxID=29920 RepID=A0A8T1CVU1_9STRA|nr:hypothetical protein PC115_g7334 [Phytophthora cactorum]